MGFDPCNISLKVWKSIETPIPKMGAHLGVWRFIPSHCPTLPKACDVTPMLPSWLTPLQALALVTSPKLGLRHYSRRQLEVHLDIRSKPFNTTSKFFLLSFIPFTFWNIHFHHHLNIDVLFNLGKQSCWM